LRSAEKKNKKSAQAVDGALAYRFMRIYVQQHVLAWSCGSNTEEQQTRADAIWYRGTERLHTFMGS
jgi:hypothetical protein